MDKEKKYLTPDAVEDMMAVEKIRFTLRENKGLLTPRENIEAMGLMAHYHTRMTERAAKYKAMKDEFFAELLSDDELKITKAKALANGSEFGQKATYFEGIAEAYLEIIQTLKKVQEYYQMESRNQV